MENAKDIVIGLDSSTQSTKAIAWSHKGEALAEGRASIPMFQPQPGYAEQNIQDWWKATCEALKDLGTQIDTSRVAGIAISNQRETVGFIDQLGQATHPAILWIDERAGAEVKPLNEAIGQERLHRITGKPADIIPVIYRLSWLRHHAPEVLDKTHKILDVHAFLSGKLTGRQASSWTSADPFGVLDIKQKQWSKTVLDHLKLTPAKFPDLVAPGTKVGEITQAAADATGLKPGTPLYCAGGDGQCAGLGVNATRKGRAYLNLGTAIAIGAWSPIPEISFGWRTMVSPTGEGYFLEGVQRGGTYLVDWYVNNFVSEKPGPELFVQLEEQAQKIPIGSQGLIVCPYLVGCMDPHWDSEARASFNGLGQHHTKYHVYRAILEALSLEITRCIHAMRASGVAVEKILVVGGGAASPLWTQMVADASGIPLVRSKSNEASSLGAGISAAVGAGWYAGFEEAATAMSQDGETITPNTKVRTDWDSLSERQAASYVPSSK